MSIRSVIVTILHLVALRASGFSRRCGRRLFLPWVTRSPITPPRPKAGRTNWTSPSPSSTRRPPRSRRGGWTALAPVHTTPPSVSRASPQYCVSAIPGTAPSCNGRRGGNRSPGPPPHLQRRPGASHSPGGAPQQPKDNRASHRSAAAGCLPGLPASHLCSERHRSQEGRRTWHYPSILPGWPEHPCHAVHESRQGTRRLQPYLFAQS